MKVATVVFAGTESHDDLARMVNAMMVVREFTEAGDDATLIFDGAATRWPGKLSDPDHVAHRLYESVRGAIAGACSYCADSFDATDDVREAGVTLLDEYKRHPSFRSLVVAGYEVLTF
ncbi:MAG: hypothetical protein M3N57_11050 [Actinomycetota bacterium]|nr:hypothetical protein [Actinomycetota bacterium]